MSQPRISASWETIGQLKKIAAKHGCFRDDDDTVPCVGAMLYEIGEGNLVVIDAKELAKLKAKP